MADQYIGGNVTMRITDEGYNVSFWILTDQYTFNHQQQWSWSDSGVQTFDMNNRGSWQLVGRVGIPNSRNVGWTIYNSGLGFPTSTITIFVNRATVPPAPTINDVHPISSSAIHVGFYGNGDGGAGIDSWQIGYGTDPNGPQYFVGSNGQTDIGGLGNGSYWYFWARGHNAQGWGNWSNRGGAWPFRTPDPPSSVSVTNVKNVSADTKFTGNWDGGTPVREWQLAYGTDPNTAQIYVASPGTLSIAGLTPKSTYYFWARGRNDVGWGNWSPRSSVLTQDVPDAPSSVVLSGATQTTINTAFALNGNNGQPITGQQVAYGTNPTAPEAYADVALNDILRTLEAGTLYYFWSRAKNVYGWGPLSVVQTARTVAGAWLNVNGVWKEAVPYVNVNGEWKLAQAWAKIAGVWKGMQ